MIGRYVMSEFSFIYIFIFNVSRPQYGGRNTSKKNTYVVCKKTLQFNGDAVLLRQFIKEAINESE